MARRRNPRGEGTRLRDEIVDGALRLVDAGGPEAVTLRAVAREVGISAPSIYDHFPDRDAILAAAVQAGFAELAADLEAANDGIEDPVQALDAGCAAYVRFAERKPARYALLFRHKPHGEKSFGDEGDQSAVAFGILVSGIEACAQAGRSTSEDPFKDAVAVWSGMHGYAGLHTTLEGFPWPEPGDTLRRLVHGLARITESRS